MCKMKRLGSLVLVVLMLLTALLAGCGASKETAGTDASKEKAPEAAAEKKEEAAETKLAPVELNAYFLAPQVKDLPVVNEEVNKVLKEKINATVKLNYFFWDSYQDKQRLVIASGEAIDVMFAPSWWGFSNYVAQKAFLPLDELLDKHGKDIVDNIHPAYLKAPRFDGVLYGIPTAKDMTGVGGVLVNKALAEKYNFDFSNIKTPRDFEPMFEVIKEKEPGIVPFLSTKGDQMVYFMQNFFENLCSVEVPVVMKKSADEIKVLNVYEAPEFIDAVKMSREWYNKGYINKDSATIQDGMPIKKAQKAFMWAEQLKPGKAEEMEAQLGYKLIQVNAYSDVKPFANTNDLTNSMLAIPRAAKNPERAMMFISMLFTDKKLKNLLSWGIEGKHYKKIGENQIDFADGVNAQNSGYTGMAQWSMGGNQFLDYLWANEPADKWEQFKKFNDSAVISKTVGWIFNQDSVKTEVATLTNVGKNLAEPLSRGVVDYDAHYPKLKAALDKAGIDKVIAEAQKQAEEFIAKNK